MTIKNIGIYAHVDAGKTTITENLLYSVGVRRKIGRVDHGSTLTDSMELEKKRGISIQAAPVSFNINNIKVNLIDTPGHADFVSEVERSMNVLDGAILVISAKEGVQSHTILIFEALKRLRVPTIIFVNKIDRIGVNIQDVLTDIAYNLTKRALPVQKVNQSVKDSRVSDILSYDIDNAAVHLADYDDELLKQILEDVKILKQDIDNKIKLLSKKSIIYPIIYGSALHGIGVKELIKAIDLLLPCSGTKEIDEVSGTVFKIKRNNNNERKIYVRLYRGILNVRDYVKGHKITRISTLLNGKEQSSNQLVAGDIGVLYGLSSLTVGENFGVVDEDKKVTLGKPTVKVEILPVFDSDRLQLLNALTIVSEEDPFLEYELSEIDNKIYISIFGEIQMEILQHRLSSKFGVDVQFNDATTIYKETPIHTGYAEMNKYQKGNPFYATIGFTVKPNEIGRGVEYVSKVTTGHLPQTFQNGIVDGVNTAITQGLMGWELNDIKILLTKGDYCSVNSTPADFRNLAPMVLLEAVYNAKTKLQWPIYSFKLSVPSYAIGKAVSDLSKMKADFSSPVLKKNKFIIEGSIPVELCNKYDLEVRSYTEGKGVFLTKFYRYEDAPSDIIKERIKTRVDPLNKTMYIMYKRGAIK